MTGGTRDWEAALEDAYARLGTRDPRCPCCGETNPFALTRADLDIVCYERAAQRWLEDHHLAGRNNDPFTITLPGNDHRVVSARQQLWPRDTLRNPSGRPLLQAAAFLRGFLDLLRLVLERLGWIPAFLEQ